MSVGGQTDDPIISYAPTPVRTGYTLDGWAYDAGGTQPVGETDVALEPDTLYAVWEAIEYDITYELDDGVNAVANPATFDTTDLPVVLENATKTGYTFDGWYTDAELTVALADSTITTIGDKTVYAKFEIVEYDITYELDGGDNDVGNPATFDVTDLPLILGDATKALNDFGGWFTDAGLTTELADGTIIAVGDVTLYAKFTLSD